jgi:hypothetical protein
MTRGPRPSKSRSYLTVEIVSDDAPRGDGLVRYDDMADAIHRSLMQLGIRVHVFPSVPRPPPEVSPPG